MPVKTYFFASHTGKDDDWHVFYAANDFSEEETNLLLSLLEQDSPSNLCFDAGSETGLDEATLLGARRDWARAEARLTQFSEWIGSPGYSLLYEMLVYQDERWLRPLQVAAEDFATQIVARRMEGASGAEQPEPSAKATVDRKSESTNSSLSGFQPITESGSKKESDRNGDPSEQDIVAPVVLRGPDQGPIVLGKEKKRLTKPRYDVIVTLLETERRLTKDELAQRSKHSDPLGILRRLIESDDDWKAVIDMAGQTACGYAIRK